VDDFNKSLNELLRIQQSVTQKLIENDGILIEDLEKELEISEKGLPKKVDNYAFVLDKLETEIDYFMGLSKKYKQVADKIEHGKELLRSRLKGAMIQNGILEIKGNNERFVLTASQKVLEINEELLPKKYKKEIITITRKPDRDLIKSEIESGNIVPGCELKANLALRRYVNK